jgi:hypothetical protein
MIVKDQKIFIRYTHQGLVIINLHHNFILIFNLKYHIFQLFISFNIYEILIIGFMLLAFLPFFTVRFVLFLEFIANFEGINFSWIVFYFIW